MKGHRSGKGFLDVNKVVACLRASRLLAISGMLTQMLRGTPLAAIIALLSLMTPAEAVSGVRCEAAFGLNDRFFDRANRSLTESLENSEIFTKRLEIRSEGIRPLEFLGHGFSGKVFRVQKDGREYALKLFHSDRAGLQELDGIVIQKHLAELGMAPQVEGVLNRIEARKLTENHRSFFETQGYLRPHSQFEMGLLMELVSAENLKTVWHDQKKRYVPSHVKDRIIDQSLLYLEILEKLSIHPKDPDAVITDRGDLMLIDTSFYTRQLSERTHEDELLIQLVDESLTSDPSLKTDSLSSKPSKPGKSQNVPWWQKVFGRYPLAE